MTHPAHRLLDLLPPLGRLDRILIRQRQTRQLAEASALLPRLLAAVKPAAGWPRPETWAVRGALRTASDMTVIQLGPPAEPPAAILKLSRTREGAASLRRQARLLAELESDPRLGDWGRLLPGLLAQGEVDGLCFVFEQALPGRPGLEMIADPGRRARVHAAAIAAIGELHRRTARARVAEADFVEQWVERPVRALRQWNDTHPRSRRYAQAVDRLAAELRGALLGRRHTVGWVHGDLWIGNLLATADGATLTGLVDWGQAAPDGPPWLDVVHCLLSTRTLVKRQELGEVVRGLIAGGAWTAEEQALAEAGRGEPPEAGLDLRIQVLMAWLHHTAAGLAKSARYARHWLWARRNIAGVLDRL